MKRIHESSYVHSDNPPPPFPFTTAVVRLVPQEKLPPPEPPSVGKSKKGYGYIRNVSEPGLLAFNQERSPTIYSTFTVDGMLPLTIGYADPRFPPGKNLFDRRVARNEQQQCGWSAVGSRRQEEAEQRRQSLIQDLLELQGSEGDQARERRVDETLSTTDHSLAGQEQENAGKVDPNLSFCGSVATHSVSSQRVIKKKPLVICCPPTYQPSLASPLAAPDVVYTDIPLFRDDSVCTKPLSETGGRPCRGQPSEVSSCQDGSAQFHRRLGGGVGGNSRQGTGSSFSPPFSALSRHSSQLKRPGMNGSGIPTHLEYLQAAAVFPGRPHTAAAVPLRPPTTPSSPVRSMAESMTQIEPTSTRAKLHRNAHLPTEAKRSVTTITAPTAATPTAGAHPNAGLLLAGQSLPPSPSSPGSRKDVGIDGTGMRHPLHRITALVPWCTHKPSPRKEAAREAEEAHAAAEGSGKGSARFGPRAVSARYPADPSQRWAADRRSPEQPHAPQTLFAPKSTTPTGDNRTSTVAGCAPVLQHTTDAPLQYCVDYVTECMLNTLRSSNSSLSPIAHPLEPSEMLTREGLVPPTSSEQACMPEMEELPSSGSEAGHDIHGDEVLHSARAKVYYTINASATAAAAGPHSTQRFAAVVIATRPPPLELESTENTSGVERPTTVSGAVQSQSIGANPLSSPCYRVATTTASGAAAAIFCGPPKAKALEPTEEPSKSAPNSPWSNEREVRPHSASPSLASAHRSTGPPCEGPHSMGPSRPQTAELLTCHSGPLERSRENSGSNSGVYLPIASAWVKNRSCERRLAELVRRKECKIY